MDRWRALAALAAAPIIGAGSGRAGMSDVNELAGELEHLERLSVTEPPADFARPVETAYTRASEVAPRGQLPRAHLRRSVTRP